MSKKLPQLDGDSWESRTARVGFPILVEYARHRSPITYGEWDREIVERGLGRHMIAVRYGGPAGVIGNACQAYANNSKIPAPLINLMVVNQGNGMPGKGADPYIKEHCWKIQGRKVNPESLSQTEKKALIDQAHTEIFDFSHWAEVLNAYGLKETERTTNVLAHPPRRRPNPSGWHTGPESEAHKTLKRSIAENPQLVKLPKGQKGKEEHRLWSGDEVDVYFAESSTAVEVKTHNAHFDELHRGIFQCVKYRAVLRAQQIYDRIIPTAECILAVGGRLPRDLQEVAHLLQVRFFQNLAD
jgi:hypothetical protein